MATETPPAANAAAPSPTAPPPPSMARTRTTCAKIVAQNSKRRSVDAPIRPHISVTSCAEVRRKGGASSFWMRGVASPESTSLEDLFAKVVATLWPAMPKRCQQGPRICFEMCPQPKPNAWWLRSLHQARGGAAAQTADSKVVALALRVVGWVRRIAIAVPLRRLPR